MRARPYDGSISAFLAEQAELDAAFKHARHTGTIWEAETEYADRSFACVRRHFPRFDDLRNHPELISNKGELWVYVTQYLFPTLSMLAPRSNGRDYDGNPQNAEKVLGDVCGALARMPVSWAEKMPYRTGLKPHEIYDCLHYIANRLEREDAEAVAATAVLAKQSKEDEAPAGRPKRIARTEVEARVRKWLSANAKGNLAAITRSHVATGTGVSVAAVGRTNAWRGLVAARKKA